MSLAFHFFKKDVRRSSWLLLLWFLLHTVEGFLALAASPPSLTNDLQFSFTGLAMNLLLFPFLRVIVLAVLVPQLIQADPLVGSDAFWLTKPVSRGTLFRAKLAALGLIVSIPLVVNATVLSAVGMAPSELPVALAEILMRQLFFVVPIALLATLTPKFLRFAGVTVAVVIGVLVYWLIPSLPINAGSAADQFTATAQANTRSLVETTLLILGGGLILAHQYLTRQNRSSIVLVACLAGAFLLVNKFWTWDLAPGRILPATTAILNPEKVTLQISASSLNNSPSIFPTGSLGKNIDGSCVLKGIPPELLVQVRSVYPQLSTVEGKPIGTLGAIPTSTFSTAAIDQSATSPIAAALGGIPVYSSIASGASTTFVTVDHDTFLKYQDSPIKLASDIDFVVSRYELEAEMPLVTGARYDRGSRHAKITGIETAIDRIIIALVESAVNLRFKSSMPVFGEPTDPRLRGDPIYVLVNRGRGEAALADSSWSSAGGYRFGGMIVQKSFDRLFVREGDPRAPVIDSKWLEGATLVRLERVPVAELRKTAVTQIQKLGEPWESDGADTKATTHLKLEDWGPGRENASTMITVGKNGTVSLDGKSVTDDQLEALLLRTHSVDANATVLIISDERADTKKMTAVLDSCHRAGITKVRIENR